MHAYAKLYWNIARSWLEDHGVRYKRHGALHFLKLWHVNVSWHTKKRQPRGLLDIANNYAEE